MKCKNLCSVFFFFFFLLVLDVKAFTQSALERKVTLQVKNADVKRVLKLIEEQSQIKFAYSPENIRNEKISLNVEGQPVGNVLKQILDNQDLTFEAVGNLVVLHKSHEIFKQVTITGKVVDENGDPLPGVTVKVKGNTIGTSTDMNGNYSLRAPDESGTLVFSFIGFVVQEIPINKQTVINVNMVPDSRALSEVVVIGYGTQRRENVIGSIAQIGSEQIENRQVTQLQNALTGQLAGVTVTQRNGRPGFESGAISVRGVGSFGASADALILVDGIPVGGFNEIDPNDVESISVLKDASSAAIYGARAANGVVLVTTKSGKAGKTQVSYNGYSGFQKPTELPELVNSWEYQQAFFEATNATSSPTGSAALTDEQIAVIARYQAQNDPEYPNTDFLNSVITQNSLQTGHNITVSGGTETNKYNISAGYLYQDGLIADNSYSRYNLRLNLNTVLSPKFDLVTRVATTLSNINEPYAPTGANPTDVLDIIDLAVRIPNTFVGQYPNGDYGLGINSYGTPISLIATPSFRKERDINLNGNTRLDYKAFKGFKASFIGSYVQGNGRETQFRSTQRLNSIITLSPNQLTDLSNTTYYYTLQGLAEYTKQFGKHQINILGGYSFEKNQVENFNAFRDNLPGNDLTALNVGSPGNQQSAGTGSEYALESQFARANYGYANKYLVEAVIRRDGSSRFPTDNKYAYFPSVAVGWRIGEERFVKDNLPWLNELKLKASRGVLGNQNLGNNYPYQNTLGTSSASNGGTLYSFGGTIAQGVARTQIVDSTLHWESTRTTDVGIELGAFKNKLNFSATYFDRYTYDILYSPGSSVSNVLGFDLSQRNTGKLRNSGWEFTVAHNNSIGNFGYNVNGNFTYVNNKVLDLGVGNILQPNGLIGNGSNLFIGYPNSNNNYSLYYGFISDGLFVDQADISAWPTMEDVNPAIKPGDIRYKDISGPEGVPDGIVDNDYDRAIIGSQIPKYSFGLNLGANYKGFDISTLLQGITGVKGYLNEEFGYALFNLGSVQRWQYDERWTEQNPNRNASYPRIENVTTAGTANSIVSSFWTIDGSYLRIKNLQLGYTIPKNVIQKAKLSNVRLYVSGENLHTFSNYREGWDPEINTGGNFYPITASYTLGLNVTF